MGKVTPLKIDVNDGRLPLKDKGLDMKDFSSVAELRRDQLEKLAAGFRMFAHFGFNEGVAGHITYRDPEFPDHFWVNPLGVHFSQISVSDLILVNHEGEVVQGDKAVNVDRTTIGGNFEWRPSDDFMLRGSWSESFRAPDMQRAFLERVEGFTSGIDYYQCWLSTGAIDNCGDFNKINIVTITEGNKSLKDEAGDSYSLGFVWEPAERLTLTVDAYKVVLQD